MTQPQPHLSRVLSRYCSKQTQEYIPGIASFRDVFSLASSITMEYAHGGKKGGPLCIATSSKSVVMAAVLASLGGGPLLVLPASLSNAAINEACTMIRASAVLSDRPVAVPKGVHLILPDKAGTKAKTWRMVRRHDQPFLWLYTGGSTGTPMLWPKTPDNLIGEAFFLKNKFAIKKTDVFLSTVSPLHIYGLLFSVLLPFISGAHIVDEVPYFPREIVRTADRAQCSIFIGSPVHYRALATSAFRMTHLRKAFSSGGFLETDHSLMFSRATGTGVTEVYGSTETGGIATRCQADGRTAWKPFSCARWTIDNGRLAVSSPFLSPNLRRNKKGFFVTGDRAEAPGKRTFTLLGRVDGIVKIGGKRVDLAAIEQKIKSLGFIRDAWVLSLPSTAGRENEIGVLVVTKKPLPHLRKAFARLLEPTHLPRRIVGVRSIPMTPAGKKDRSTALSLLARTAKNPG